MGVDRFPVYCVFLCLFSKSMYHLALTSSLVPLEVGKWYCERVPADRFVVSLLIMS